MAADGNGKLHGYEEKFADFIRLCATVSPGDMVTIATPHALGDNYDEIIESLNRLSDSEAHLVIVPRDRR